VSISRMLRLSGTPPPPLDPVLVLEVNSLYVASVSILVGGMQSLCLASLWIRDGNRSGRAITHPSVKELRIEIHTHTHIHG
jgi:hypothetical protein